MQTRASRGRRDDHLHLLHTRTPHCQALSDANLAPHCRAAASAFFGRILASSLPIWR